jgi:uncharacterized protein (TIGR00730 family)
VKRLCVFCGSNIGDNPIYTQATRALAVELVSRDIEVVYGGGNVGLMGILADAVIAAGGRIVGVMPRALVDREIAHAHLTQLHVVDSMHERKAQMSRLADGFLALPGGFGTLDEFFEAVTWTQLGVHRKPCGLLNVARFYDPLIEFLEHATDEHFVHPEHRAIVLHDPRPAALLDRMEAFVVPDIPKWLRQDEV